MAPIPTVSFDESLPSFLISEPFQQNSGGEKASSLATTILLKRHCEKRHGLKRETFASTVWLSYAFSVSTIDYVNSFAPGALIQPASSDDTPPLHSSSKPLKYLSKKALIDARNNRLIPEIREEDIEETFVRGTSANPSQKAVEI